ncbi:ATPase domain-containing protein [Halomonas nitroreducens]|uniref:non-specific serine/threonine protein kinase n=1 Tax=Halomonas nitroreducens TaxID=447425 RepID=A0A431V4A1_9GAMM|nr:ATPase domain-containing protein [Halomonas nitroreducens]RTR05068.1 circadian clock protein KaiC [Halomonas nitroreducens]
MEETRISTGCGGLDHILGGGLPPRKAYMLRGGPGLGKTSLGLQFLAAARHLGEALYIGFQESEAHLLDNARRQSLDIAGVHLLSLGPDETLFTDRQHYDIFHPAEVELEPLVQRITDAIDAHQPQTVFIDSINHLNLLFADTFQFRAQILSFLRYLCSRGCTVMFSTDAGSPADSELQFLADGVIELDEGFLQVRKLRGAWFMTGRHQYRVGVHGLQAFPHHLPPAASIAAPVGEPLSSGSPCLDRLLGGGIEPGTTTLITGPSGVGKSTLAASFARQASRHGRVAIYLFEEELPFYFKRADDLAMGLSALQHDGLLAIEQVEPMRYLADEFLDKVRHETQATDTRLVVLDSVSGFELSLNGENLKERVHAFAKGLARRGISVLLINEIQAISGPMTLTERGISYLADNVLLLNYREENKRMGKMLGVLKKRTGSFDTRICPYRIGPGGVRLLDDEVEASLLNRGNPS